MTSDPGPLANLFLIRRLDLGGSERQLDGGATSAGGQLQPVQLSRPALVWYVTQADILEQRQRS